MLVTPTVVVGRRVGRCVMFGQVWGPRVPRMPARPPPGVVALGAAVAGAAVLRRAGAAVLRLRPGLVLVALTVVVGR